MHKRSHQNVKAINPLFVYKDKKYLGNVNMLAK
jgi:hypothetical protein